jgi:hypothetical protein
MLAIVGILAATPGSSAFAADAKKPRRGPEVLVVADAVDAPESLRPVPGQPIYYVVLGKTERHLGQASAGEPMPDPADVEAQVTAVLATQGFRKTAVGGPMPSIALVITWGEANLMIDEFGFSNSDADGEDGEMMAAQLVAWNRREIRQLVGANKPALLSYSEADLVNEAARNDRLHVTIAALDAQALARKEKKLVWRTRISVYAHRQTLAEVLPVMLASAAPMFGIGSRKPVFIDDALRRKADVQIGELQVIDDHVPQAESPPAKNEDRK